MCISLLERGSKLEEEMKAGAVFGYKIFVKRDGLYYFPCFDQDKAMQLGDVRYEGYGWPRFLNEEEAPFHTYRVGFHFCPTREDARRYKKDALQWPRFTEQEPKPKLVIVKCLMREFRAAGIQRLHKLEAGWARPTTDVPPVKVGVAGNMKLLREVR